MTVRRCPRLRVSIVTQFDTHLPSLFLDANFRRVWFGRCVREPDGFTPWWPALRTRIGHALACLQLGQFRTKTACDTESPMRHNGEWK